MSYTKAELRTRTLQLADAIDASRWDASIDGEVDKHIGTVFDREWKRILNADPYYRVWRGPWGVNSEGYYELAALNTESGDSRRRWYRIIAFSRDSTVYEQSRLDQYLLPDTSSPQPQFIWYFEGEYVLALPIQTTGSATVLVNWIPVRYDDISGEDVPVDFPDGYEDIIAWSAASKLLNKSGSEAGRAQVLELQAEALREDMLQDLARRSLAPIRMKYTDSTWDYGG